MYVYIYKIYSSKDGTKKQKWRHKRGTYLSPLFFSLSLSLSLSPLR